ncbi:MAG: hypothetical protein AAGA42_07600 [Actinomycetota bacterium]
MSARRNPLRAAAVATVLATGVGLVGAPTLSAAAPTQTQMSVIDGFEIEDPIGWGAYFGQSFFHFISQDPKTWLEPSNLLSMLGFGQDFDIGAAFADVEAAIADVRTAIEGLSSELELLFEGQDRTNFFNSYTASGEAATALGSEMAKIGGWVKYGVEPDESHVAEVQDTITTAIDKLGFNTANSTTGTIPLMMRVAETAKVSDLVDYWAAIDSLRDGYRASLAQGVMALHQLADWDPTRAVAADAQTFKLRAHDHVKTMYEHGVGIEQNPARSAQLVYPHGSTHVYAPGDYPGSGSELWRDVSYAQGDLEPVLQHLAQEYFPASHDGVTLETYLAERGYPTRYYYSDTFEVTSWENGAYWTYQAWATQGRIVGNSYETIRQPIGVPHAYNEGADAAWAEVAALTPHGTALRVRDIEVGMPVDTDVQMPANSSYVHVRGDDAVYAPPTYDGWTDEVWNDLGYFETELEPVLQHLAASYDPAHHDGQTLEAYLTERGFATTYWYLDTAFVDQIEGDLGWTYQAKARIGRITGNTYEWRTLALADEVGTSAEAQAEVALLISTYLPATALRTMAVTVDHAGRAADLTEEAILAAAYPDTGYSAPEGDNV